MYWITLLAIMALANTQLEGCESFAAPNKCSHCLRGYYLQTNFVCGQCPTGCVQCQAPDVCLGCRRGYFFSKGDCLAGPIHCIDVDTEGTCQSCMLGYELVNKECIVCPDFCDSCSKGKCTNCSYGFGLDRTSDGQ